MKRLATYALLLLCTLSTVTVSSQIIGNSKPKQFDAFPGIINCTESELGRVFASSEGQNISLSLSNDFSFAGVVTSNMVKYSNLQSAVIKSPTYNNSVFNISKRVNADNSITYVGHIINLNYFDGYELRRNTAGIYQLIKIETDKVIPICAY